ncbi:hypothetical protein [Actinomyces marmotae]|uniref:hypothetical protein n=1 Tax=Actinomyces marmotae TaxID=2737173 RepID=UPI00135B4811|nr:hypothetical protein [Actinomyces marmotae]
MSENRAEHLSPRPDGESPGAPRPYGSWPGQATQSMPSAGEAGALGDEAADAVATDVFSADEGIEGYGVMGGAHGSSGADAAPDGAATPAEAPLAQTMALPRDAVLSGMVGYPDPAPRLPRAPQMPAETAYLPPVAQQDPTYQALPAPYPQPPGPAMPPPYQQAPPMMPAGPPMGAPAPQPLQPLPARPGPSWYAVMLAWIWRASITGLAGYGLWLQLDPVLRADRIVGGHALVLGQLRFFTTLSNAVVLVIVAGALLEPLVGRAGAFSLGLRAFGQWARGLAVVMAVFTGLVFGLIMKGGFDRPISWIPHLALPAAMTLDWVLVGRNQNLLRFSTPVTWTMALLPYILLYMWDARRNGHPMYRFLDPNKDDWLAWIGSLVGGFFVLALVVWILGRFRGAIVASGERARAAARAGAGGGW